MIVNLTVALPIIISQIIVVNPSMAESTLSKSAYIESKGLFPVCNPPFIMESSEFMRLSSEMLNNANIPKKWYI